MFVYVVKFILYLFGQKIATPRWLTYKVNFVFLLLYKYDDRDINTANTDTSTETNVNVHGNVSVNAQTNINNVGYAVTTQPGGHEAHDQRIGNQNVVTWIDFVKEMQRNKEKHFGNDTLPGYFVQRAFDYIFHDCLEKNETRETFVSRIELELVPQIDKIKSQKKICKRLLKSKKDWKCFGCKNMNKYDVNVCKKCPNQNDYFINPLLFAKKNKSITFCVKSLDFGLKELYLGPVKFAIIIHNKLELIDAINCD